MPPMNNASAPCMNFHYTINSFAFSNEIDESPPHIQSRQVKVNIAFLVEPQYGNKGFYSLVCALLNFGFLFYDEVKR